MPKKRRRSGKLTRRSVKKAKDHWFTIRDILDERVANGRVEYLVDWDDDPETGRSYTPSWSDSVTDLAKQDWDKKKEAAVEPSQPVSHDDDDDDDEDQSLRPATRHQSRRPDGASVTRPRPETPDPEAPPPKRQRIDDSSRLPRESIPSITSTASAVSADGSLSPVGSQELRTLQHQTIAIELSKDPAFDPSAYLFVSNNTQASSQPVSELEEEDHRIALASQLSNYDTIPDSQDPSTDFSYQPTQDSAVPNSTEWEELPYSSRHTSADSRVIPDSQDPPSFYSNIGESGSSRRQESLGRREEPDQSQLEAVPKSDVAVPENPSQRAPDQLEETAFPETEIVSETSTHQVVPDQSQEEAVPNWDTVISDQTIPDQPQEESVPESDAPGPEIPSRQLDGPGHQAVDIQDFHTASDTQSDRRFASEPAGIASQHSINQTQLSSEPVLSQLEVALDLAHPQGSLASQLPEPHGTVVTETSGDTDQSKDTSQSQAPTESSSRESQAAQIVRKDLGSLPQILPDSDTTERNSQAPPEPNLQGTQFYNDQPTTESVPEFSATSTESSTLRQSSSLERSSYFQTILEQLFRAGTSRPSSSASGVSQRMSSEMDESVVSRPARSAVDELKALVDFSSATHYPPEPESEPEPELDVPVVGGNESALGVSNPEQSAGTSLIEHAQVGSGITLHRPEFEMHSGPIQPADPWEPEVAHSHGIPPQSISPASIMNNPPRSAVDALRDIVDQSFSTADDLVVGGLIPEPSHELQQTTVSPADISRLNETNETPHTLLPLSDPPEMSRTDESSGQSITMGQMNDEQVYGEPSMPAQNDTSPFVHFVTLPFHANRRPVYHQTLLDYKSEATAFSRIFSNEVYEEPDKSLVRRIDELFSDLINICDFPQDIIGTENEHLPPLEKTKYCSDANPKFSFLFELFEGLKRAGKETVVLIVSRSLELLRLLFALTEALELECVCDAIGKPESCFQGSDINIRLALSSEDHDPYRYEVVIGFDYSFPNSPVAQRLSYQSDKRPPLIMLLVTTHSIEHINLYVPQDIPPPERKNALLSGIVHARLLITDPERGYPEPHEAAETFVTFLTGSAESLIWEPQPIPDHVLDVYVNSQSRSQIPPGVQLTQAIGLKRKLDDAGDDDEDTKRIRIFPLMESTIEAKEAPLSDAVQALLRSASPRQRPGLQSEAKVSVSLAALESLAEQFSECNRRISAASGLDVQYKATISRLEREVKDYSRTANKMSESLRKAYQDRALFEKEKLKAEEALKSAQEAVQKDIEKSRKRIVELEATVARLSASSEGSNEESPLARYERLYKEAQDKVAVLEKRLANAHKDGDYVRNLYQDVNAAYGNLNAEHKGLQARNTALEQKASENVARIHQIQTDNTIKDCLCYIDDLRVQIRERDIELDRLREELRLLKNGRRETRQASVPRSPRMGVMSPRPGARGFASGSASRGTSPAPALGSDGLGPGMQFLGHQQSGNGRWTHLRD